MMIPVACFRNWISTERLIDMKSVYTLSIGTLCVCGLLLAAVLAPTGSSAPNSSNRFDSQTPDASDGEENLSSAEPTKDLPPVIVEPPAETPDGMVWVPGGRFVMGIESFPKPGEDNPDKLKPDEFPAHEVELDGFWIDQTPVTNAEFKKFVDATGYVTFSEKTPTKEDFAKSGIDVSQIDEKQLRAGSICFNSKFDKENLVTGIPGWEYQVWAIVDGADWRHPTGPDSSIKDKMDHPVVHVTWDDAVAYCQWAGKRLPTEAEFEYAARSGGKPVKYPWGNELIPDGKYMANYWQGEFPTSRLIEDGYKTTSPVKAFPPNELGIYDMSGNVWEWCSDYFHITYYADSEFRNPKGPPRSLDLRDDPNLVKRVQRGGSFMCNVNSCTGYRTGARMAGEVMSSSFHNGFRCVVDTKLIDDYQRRQSGSSATNKQATSSGE